MFNIPKPTPTVEHGRNRWIYADKKMVKENRQRQTLHSSLFCIYRIEGDLNKNKYHDRSPNGQKEPEQGFG